MPSPFPGMNPYLELPALWHEFDNRLIVAISDALGTRIMQVVDDTSSNSTIGFV